MPAFPWMDALSFGGGLANELFGSGKASRRAQNAQTNWLRYQLAQAKQYGAQKTALMPHLYEQAGYRYAPGANGGAPSITPIDPRGYGQDPYYQAERGGFTQGLERARQSGQAAINENAYGGSYQKGVGQQILNQGIAESEAGFNRTYLEDQRQRQLAIQSQILGLIGQGEGQGNEAAAGLGAYAQATQAQNAAQLQAAAGNLAADFRPAPKKPPTATSADQHAGTSQRPGTPVSVQSAPVSINSPLGPLDPNRAVPPFPGTDPYPPRAAPTPPAPFLPNAPPPAQGPVWSTQVTTGNMPGGMPTDTLVPGTPVQGSPGLSSPLFQGQSAYRGAALSPTGAQAGVPGALPPAGPTGPGVPGPLRPVDMNSSDDDKLAQIIHDLKNPSGSRPNWDFFRNPEEMNRVMGMVRDALNAAIPMTGTPAGGRF